MKEELAKMLEDDNFYESFVAIPRMLTDDHLKQIQDEFGKKYKVKISQIPLNSSYKLVV